MTVIFCAQSKNIPVGPTVSATAASGYRTSLQEGGNTRQAIGPPRNGPIRLISLVYLPNLHAVLRVDKSSENSDLRDQKIRFRWSREAHEPQFFEATIEIEILKARVSEPH